MNRIKTLSRRQKWLIAGGALALIALVAALLFKPGGAQRTLTGANLLEDGDFSNYAASGSGAWYEDAYFFRSSYTDFEVVEDEDGQISAHIVNKLANDARFAQIVDVRPNSLYLLEGDIRASASGGLGANLSVEGPYVFSESVYDQAEWKHVQLYGRTSGDQNMITVFARLGGYSGESTGEAWFRNLRLTEVEEVPAGFVAYDWYQKSSGYVADDEYEGDSEAAPSALLHGVLMVLCVAAYLLMVWYTLCRADRTKPVEATALWTFLLFGAGILVRILVAVTVHGYDVDVGDFCAWATDMVSNGPASFYRLDLSEEVRSQMFICDYPPGYILVLWLVGLLGQWLGCGATEFLIKLPPMISDLLIAWLIGRSLRENGGKKKVLVPHTAFSLCSMGLILLNPLMLLTGAGWGQSDSVMMLFLVLTLIFGMKGHWRMLPMYMLAVLMKPQALMFGPLGLVALYLLFRGDRERRGKMLEQFLTGMVALLITGAAVILPFSIGHGFKWVFDLYGKTMSYYGYTTVNACNLYFLAGANWAGLGADAPRWFGICILLLLGGPSAWILSREREKEGRKLIIPFTCTAVSLILALIGFAVPVSWQYWTTSMTALTVVLAVALCVQSGQLRHLPLYGGLLMTGIFAVGGMMHERYLFPAIVLLLWAWRIEKDDRILMCALLATVGAFLNAGCVLSRNARIGGADGHLSIPGIGHRSDMAPLEYLSALLNIGAFALTLAVGYVHAISDQAGYTFRLTQRADTASGVNRHADNVERTPLGARVVQEELEAPAARKRLDRIDLCLIVGITVAYAALAFWHLGSLTSPQNGYEFQSRYEQQPLTSADGDGEDLKEESEEVIAEEGGEYVLVTESVIFDLGDGADDYRMLYMGGVHQYDATFTVETSNDGVSWGQAYECAMDIGNLFQWFYVRTYRGERGESLSGRYVRLTSNGSGLTLMEVIFRDADGNVLPVLSAVSSMGNDVSALTDEQDTLTGEPGWYNSMYFDEIYHARTAYEHWTGMTPYETTHPPLGKVFMSWCVGLFGMTPFGWRFAGTLAGVLMLPGLYLLGRLLFKKRRYAILCCLLIALDTLHYTQTRLATIDSFVTLFIIWSYYLMFRWMLCDFFGQKLSRTLVPLGLSGLMMGLAVASKWTGCYAGVGLAVLFFISVGRRWYVCKKMRMDHGELTGRAETARTVGYTRLLTTVASCLIFFVAVPALIYYASYIPYFAPNGGVSLKRIINAAENMLAYHSSPGLGMDHPYYSPWYEWPFAVVKPMYYAADRYEPAGYASSILAFGNIAVWWPGFAGMLTVLAAFIIKQLRGMFSGYATGAEATAIAPKGEYDRRPLMLLIAFAAQFLPWMLVPRGTYIYHYFPSVPFIILCLALVCEYLGDDLSARMTRQAAQTSRSIQAAGQQADHIEVLCLSAYLLIVLAIFIAFFPYASGLTVPTAWLDAMNWFGNLYY